MEILFANGLTLHFDFQPPNPECALNRPISRKSAIETLREKDGNTIRYIASHADNIFGKPNKLTRIFGCVPSIKYDTFVFVFR